MKFASNIHGLERIDPYVVSDPLTFPLATSHSSCCPQEVFLLEVGHVSSDVGYSLAIR